MNKVGCPSRINRAYPEAQTQQHDGSGNEEFVGLSATRVHKADSDASKREDGYI